MLDSLKMLHFLSKNYDNDKLKLIGISMGNFGKITRLLSPIYGSFANYTYVLCENVTAPGQISIDEMLQFNSFMRKISNQNINFYVKECTAQGFIWNFDKDFLNIKFRVLPKEYSEICKIIDILGTK